MKPRWQPRPLFAVRIAGLPLSALDNLDMRASAAIVDQLDALAEAMGPRRDATIDRLHDLIGGCEDLALRRSALAVKRRLFNAKPLRARDLDQEWPPALAEHGKLRVAPDARPLSVGDRLELIPGYVDFTSMLHDRYYAFRGDQFDRLVRNEARGRIW